MRYDARINKVVISMDKVKKFSIVLKDMPFLPIDTETIAVSA